MSLGRIALPSTLIALLLAAGCAQDADNEPNQDSVSDETTSPSTPAPDSEPEPESEPESPSTMVPTSDVPAFPEGTAPQSGKAAKAKDLVLVDVRAAPAEGFDRIVLEFSGTGTPGWTVNYVDEAVLDGSGETVDLDGAATLDIYASNTTWPAPDYYDGPSEITPKPGGNVPSVHVAGTFEGTTQVLAGVEGAPAPFRVFTLTAPSRLVIDVEHPSEDAG